MAAVRFQTSKRIDAQDPIAPTRLLPAALRMPKTLTATPTSINPTLIASARPPSQVLLASRKMTATRPSALNEEDRTLLLLSVAQYLQKNGFSKTVKKLRSEAQLEEDGWKGPKLDLEEMCLKFLDKGNNAAIHSGGLDQDGKKKKSKEDSKNLVADHSGDADKSVHENDSIKEKKKAKRSSETLTKGRQELRPGEAKEPGSDAVNELQQNEDDNKQKNKKKKDRRSVPEPLSNGENQQVGIMPEQATGGKSEDAMTSKEKDDASCEVKKSKDKMKKKSKSTSSEIANDVEEKQDKEKSKSMKKDANKAFSEGETITSEIEKENKPQKRKRLGSEDNDSQRTDKEPLEQSKRRKKEHKESIASEQTSDVKASPNGEVDLLESQETPSKHQDGNENGNLIKTAEKSTTGKDMKRQRNGSAEPKSTTAKAFQRVKVSEVVFADEKLKDNSYWAKDGAEIGYGAKAQEVLGQVRGRDFRHEKTKKKRGSYRGGQIDLQSHSVKFNYSDDE